MPTEAEIETLIAGGDPNDGWPTRWPCTSTGPVGRRPSVDRQRRPTQPGSSARSRRSTRSGPASPADRRLLAARSRRPLLGDDGRLMIVACDHPARGALGVRGAADGDGRAGRSCWSGWSTALSGPGVDGLLATADIAEDLLLLGALEGKLVFSSMNRGGLQGAAFEMDDRNTGYDVQGTVEAGFDGGKMLTRIDLDDPARWPPSSTAARAVTELNRAPADRHGRAVHVQPGRRQDRNDLSPDAVIKSVHIAQGLGASSAYTWLKLPVVDEMERVMDATTLPTLLLGGDPEGAPRTRPTRPGRRAAAAVGARAGGRPHHALPGRRRRGEGGRHRRRSLVR